MRLAIVALLAGMFVYAGPIPSNHRVVPKTSGGLVEQIENARAAVVQVIARFDNGTSSGTGFFVNADGVVITARHVVRPSGAGQPRHIEVGLALPERDEMAHGLTAQMAGNFQGIDAVVLAEDATHDIVVLRTLANPFKGQLHRVVVFGNTLPRPKVSFAILDPHRLRDGEGIFISGYPLGMPVLITTSGFIASSTEMPMDETSKLEGVYWADIHANHGNSGGPVFSRASGAVIGMQRAIRLTNVEGQEKTTAHPLAYNSGIAEVIPATYIAALLDSQHIHYTAKP